MLRVDEPAKKHKGGRHISPSTRCAISYAINVQNRKPLGESTNNAYINKIAEELDVNPHTA